LRLLLVIAYLQKRTRIAPAKPDAKGQDQNYDTAAADSDTAAHSTAILDITAFSLVSPTHGSIRITKEI
jgi:hypothetical protein